MRKIGLAVAATAQFHHNKCMKKFFGYTKYYSVTEMLLALAGASIPIPGGRKCAQWKIGGGEEIF